MSNEKLESKEEFMSATKTDIEVDRHLNKVTLKSDIPLNSINRKKRSVASESSIQYDINKDDEELVVLIKNEINSAKISLQDIYNSGLFKDYSQGYNLYYSLTKHRQITESRLKTWATILGKKITVSIEDDNV